MRPRKLKFRAWHEKSKKFIFCTLGDGIIIMEDPEMLLVNHPTELSPWQQVSNIPSSTGEDVYEGDILKADFDGKTVRGIMEYNRPLNQFGMEASVSFDTANDLNALSGTYEVIAKKDSDFPIVLGNNHANPELIPERELSV